MSNVEKFIIQSWRDPIIYNRFAKAFKRKTGADIETYNWVGKDQGAVHPRFAHFLTNGRV